MTIRFSILPAIAFVVLVGCNKPAPPLAPPEAPSVQFELAVERKITDFETFTGKTEATEIVEVKPRVNGLLLKQSEKLVEGKDVTKNDVLFEIDPPLYEAELKRAQGVVEQEKARRDFYEANYKRIEPQFKAGAVNEKEYEEAKRDLNVADGVLKSAQAQEKIAQTNFDYTKVRAPISGRVGRRIVDPGNMVRASETALVVIVQLDPIYALFDVDERTYLRIKSFLEGTGAKDAALRSVPVTMELVEDAPPKRVAATTTPSVIKPVDPKLKGERKGWVDFIDTRVDSATGSVWIRGRFENPGKLMVPGLFARVRIPVGEERSAILIPEQALGNDQGQKFVYVINEKDETDYRPVEVGTQHGQLREIVSGNIRPGDRVIVSGLQRIRRSIKVNAQERKADVKKPAS